jgi:hypothetical protein
MDVLPVIITMQPICNHHHFEIDDFCQRADCAWTHGPCLAAAQLPPTVVTGNQSNLGSGQAQLTMHAIIAPLVDSVCCESGAAAVERPGSPSALSASRPAKLVSVGRHALHWPKQKVAQAPHEMRTPSSQKGGCSERGRASTAALKHGLAISGLFQDARQELTPCKTVNVTFPTANCSTGCNAAMWPSPPPLHTQCTHEVVCWRHAWFWSSCSSTSDKLTDLAGCRQCQSSRCVCCQIRLCGATRCELCLSRGPS